MTVTDCNAYAHANICAWLSPLFVYTPYCTVKLYSWVSCAHDYKVDTHAKITILIICVVSTVSVVRTQYTCTLHQLWLSDQLTKAVHFFCNHGQNTEHWHTPVHVEQASPVKNTMQNQEWKKRCLVGEKHPTVYFTIPLSSCTLELFDNGRETKTLRVMTINIQSFSH